MIPDIQNIQNKHWRSMKNSDQHLAEVFPEPPMVGYRKQRNLQSFLIKSKVPKPPEKYPKRQINGMLKCGKSCPTCPFIKEGKEININQNSKWKINGKLTCETTNCIYMIQCKKDNCKQRYIGQTMRQLKQRLADHKGYIKTQVVSQPTGAHFNQPGHCLANMEVTILQQAKKNDIFYRLEKEKYLINKFNTYNSGMNKER